MYSLIFIQKSKKMKRKPVIVSPTYLILSQVSQNSCCSKLIGLKFLRKWIKNELNSKQSEADIESIIFQVMKRQRFIQKFDLLPVHNIFFKNFTKQVETPFNPISLWNKWTHQFMNQICYSWKSFIFYFSLRLDLVFNDQHTFDSFTVKNC